MTLPTYDKQTVQPGRYTFTMPGWHAGYEVLVQEDPAKHAAVRVHTKTGQSCLLRDVPAQAQFVKLA